LCVFFPEHFQREHAPATKNGFQKKQVPRKHSMTQSSLVAVLTDLAAPLAASLGLELWGIELAFGGRSLVRVFVEDEKGATIDQCAELSRLLALGLDVEDIIPGAYVLEVSSPGLERSFFTEAQLTRALGSRVEVTLQRPRSAWPGRKKFRGLLQNIPDARDGLFFLKAEEPAGPDGEEVIIAFTFAEAKKITQVHCFLPQSLPGKAAGQKKARKNINGKHVPEKENAVAAVAHAALSRQDGEVAGKISARHTGAPHAVFGGATECASDAER
jgi:ribosome maturation factor RimP